MVSLAIWVAAALFLGCVGLFALGMLAVMLRSVGQFLRSCAPAYTRRPGPLFKRNYDKAAYIGIAVAFIVLFGIIVFTSAHSTIR